MAPGELAVEVRAVLAGAMARAGFERKMSKAPMATAARRLRGAGAERRQGARRRGQRKCAATRPANGRRGGFVRPRKENPVDFRTAAVARWATPSLC